MATDSDNKVLEGYCVQAGADSIHLDMVPAELVEEALAHHEGKLASNGSLVVETGKYTGRSPKDRFVVDTPDVHETIAWGNVNVPISQESYEKVRDGVAAYLGERDLYVVRGLAGADRAHARKFMIACERASQALFITQLLVRPTDEERAAYGEPDFTILAAPGYQCDPAFMIACERASQALFITQLLVRPTDEERAAYGEPDFTILAAPGYQCDPAIEGLNSEAAVLVNFAERVVVVAGTEYSGEITKSVFSVMNYLLPCSSRSSSSAPPMRSAPPTANPISPSSPPPATSATPRSRA